MTNDQPDIKSIFDRYVALKIQAIEILATPSKADLENIRTYAAERGIYGELLDRVLLRANEAMEKTLKNARQEGLSEFQYFNDRYKSSPYVMDWFFFAVDELELKARKSILMRRDSIYRQIDKIAARKQSGKVGGVQSAKARQNEEQEVAIYKKYLELCQIDKRTAKTKISQLSVGAGLSRRQIHNIIKKMETKQK